MKRHIVFIIILSLVGMGISLYLTRLHYQALMPGHTVDSFCNVSATVNCVAVSESPYASLPVGHIPVATLGFLYYLVVFALSLLALVRMRRPAPADRAVSPARDLFLFLFLFSLPALGFTAYMAVISKKLGLLCLLCLAMYALNILIFLFLPKAAGLSWKTVGAALKQALKSPRTLATGAGVATAILAIGLVVAWKTSAAYDLRRAQLVAWQEREAKKAAGAESYTQQDIEEILGIFYKQPVVALDIPADRPRWGRADASLQLVKFVDFQCPACKQATETIPEFLAQTYPGQFSIVMLNYPLNSDCNPNLKRKMHAFGCLAARIAACVHTLGGEFWDYEEQVFGHQGEINATTLYNWLPLAGVEPEAVKACVASPQSAEFVLQDVKLGDKVPVQGTPTILLNGRNLQSLWRTPALFKAVLDAELKRNSHTATDL